MVTEWKGVFVCLDVLRLSGPMPSSESPSRDGQCRGRNIQDSPLLYTSSIELQQLVIPGASHKAIA
jgi:hypothetical protein